MSFDKDDWPKAMAEWPGRVVLIGLTYLDSVGALESQEQMHGRISEVDPSRGVAIALDGACEGETFRLPPDLTSFSAAAPGVYRLRSTGEEIENPYLLTSWTINRSAKA